MRSHLIIFLSAVAALSGCGESASARYDAGYGDGYAEGYNTTLRIRSTMVRGGRTRGQAAPCEVTRLKVVEGREFRSA